MICAPAMRPVAEMPPCGAQTFAREQRPLYRPVVIRAIAADWPVVRTAQQGNGALLDQIRAMDSGAAAETMIAPQAARGRFFYADDMRGFNFRREQLSLGDLAEHLALIETDPEPIGIYAGAAAAERHLPGFTQANPFPLAEAAQAQCRLWLGNATQVAAHFDLSDNFAVVAAGRRTFTLFPPEQAENLYVGPLDRTLAGQPVSMVDPLAPDLDRYPRFAKASEQGLCAVLDPGDAIFIPALWWHHVAASSPVNLLVNYWHNDAPRGGGFLAMIHALMAIRDLPPAERRAWKSWFDTFVFGDGAPTAFDHLPDHARGVTGPVGPERDAVIRQFLVTILGS
ncbi:cupin-like domain-containing protein [Novosphingobium sp.]|uniref:cupin-like domain-containing protein n=1 Tax=Novosphingobium sp. TaxID=1874826 RepID=UPI0025FEE400|nr:cupin-like domain-containing protein [Novosphingobium sp.]